MLNKLQTIERVKKSGEMLYNKKEQLTSDLGAKKNKQLLFLVAQPRSGNTLFASIMNQNPEIAATPNSITLEIMKDLFY